jgi:hypothetical protein
MADCILRRWFELPVGDSLPLSDEQRIVTEPMVTGGSDSQPTPHLPQPDVLGTVRKDQRHGTDEPRGALSRGDIG